jgi:hypothetical protein
MLLIFYPRPCYISDFSDSFVTNFSSQGMAEPLGRSLFELYCLETDLGGQWVLALVSCGAANNGELIKA